MAASTHTKDRRAAYTSPRGHAAEERVKLRRLQQSIAARKGLVVTGEDFTAALRADGRVNYTGADRWGQGEAAIWTDVTFLAGYSDRLVGICADGTLRVAGRLSPWDHGLSHLSCVRRVSCGRAHTAALLANGRVTVCGDRGRGRCGDTADWPAVTDVVCGADFTLGLTEEGTVLITGGSRPLRYLVRSWRQVAGIFTDSEGKTVYAVTVEGTLLSTAVHPGRDWRNLVFVAATGRRLCGVTAAGRLLSNHPARRGLAEDTTHFTACAVSRGHVAVLARNGRVFSKGDNAFGQCDTRRFGTLFENFDEFNADRRLRDRRLEADAHAYQTRLSEATRYGGRLVCGPRLTACITADGRVLSSTGFGASKQWSHVCAMASGNAHLLALHTDGRVSAEGNDTDGCCQVTDWTRVKAIAAGKYHSLGLTYEGRVLFCGRDERGLGDVTSWTNVRMLAAADGYAVGVLQDGRLCVAGAVPFPTDRLEVFPPDPVSLVATPTHLAALYADGTVRSTATRPAGDRPGDGSVWDTCEWESVRAIAAGEGFTVGLCYGGRVLAVGRNDGGQCDVESWHNVVAVSCGSHYTAALTASGELLLAGRVTAVHSAPPAWSDLLTLSCGPTHLAAVNREGQVLAYGLDSDGQCAATTHFTLFRDVRQLYGYGQYRKLSECGPRREETVPTVEKTADSSDFPTQSFSAFASHLRGDSEALAARLSGSETMLCALDGEGRARTYLYEDARILTHTPDTTPTRLLCGEETVSYVTSDGSARLWRVTDGEPEAVSLPDRLGENPRYPVADLATGKAHAVLLMADGTVCALGDNDRGQGDVGSWSRITAVAAGNYHTVGLRADGTVVATGARRRESGNQNRRVAHLPRVNPCAVEDWTGVTRILCTADVTLGLCANGTLRAAGNNHFGQCRVEDWRGVVSAATSGSHTVALLSDGTVRATGLNEKGECRVDSWRRVVQLAVMPELTLGLTADGRVLASGRHHQVLETLRGVRAIACFGNSRQVFVMADGSVLTHLRGSEFPPEPAGDIRLFTPTAEGSILGRYINHTPSHGIRTAAGRFAVGMAHALYLGDGGTIHGVGANDYGQGDLSARGNAVFVAAGPYHSAAITAEGHVVLSGRNTHGQCDAAGLNTELGTVAATADETRSSIPGESSDSAPYHRRFAWSRVACGYEHTVALRTDGRVYAVGHNPDGRCDTRQWRGVTDMACGMRHTVAILEDGSCVATGDDRYGQCAVGHWQGAVQVAAGEFHTVALFADGHAEAVGDNRRGQCDLGGLSDVIHVACLPDSTLCVHADGRVSIHGGSGELDEALSALSEVVSLSACEYRVAALTADRRLILLPRRGG